MKEVGDIMESWSSGTCHIQHGDRWADEKRGELKYVWTFRIQGEIAAIGLTAAVGYSNGVLCVVCMAQVNSAIRSLILVLALAKKIENTCVDFHVGVFVLLHCYSREKLCFYYCLPV